MASRVLRGARLRRSCEKRHCGCEVNRLPHRQRTPRGTLAGESLLADAYELADARARIEGLERLIDELAGQRDRLETERDDWKDAARELRVLLKGAQDSTRALTATLEPLTIPELRDTPHGAQAAPDAPHGAAPALSAWERLRRWAGGGS